MAEENELTNDNEKDVTKRGRRKTAKEEDGLAAGGGATTRKKRVVTKKAPEKKTTEKKTSKKKSGAKKTGAKSGGVHQTSAAVGSVSAGEAKEGGTKEDGRETESGDKEESDKGIGGEEICARGDAGKGGRLDWTALKISVAKKKGMKKGSSASTKKAGRCPQDVVDEVQAVLLELMKDSESDSVRVAAAKALIDKIRENEDEADEKGADDDERATSIAEACAILDALAEALSRGVSGEVAMVAKSEGGTDHAQRNMADLVDPCGARMGKDADGG